MDYRNALLWIAVFLILNTTHASALTAALQDNSAEAEKVERANYTCSIEGMSDLESQRILDALADGLLGSQIGSGTVPNPDREESPNSTLVIPLDQENATKVEVADEKFDVAEIQHLLNDNIHGAYSFGVVLDDTLRVGRCNDLEDKNLTCPLTEKSLNYRNSGTAFNKEAGKVADFFTSLPLIEKLKSEGKSRIEEMDEEDLARIAEETGIPEEQQQQFMDNLVLSDLNDSNIEAYVRLNQKMIPNSILAENFSASSQTNTSQGVISVYSLFDKLYNKWFSGDMVLSLAAPALWFRAKKLFLQYGRPGRFPWRFSKSALADKIRMKFFGPDTRLGKWRAHRVWRQAAQHPESAGRLRYELTEVLDDGWTDACYLGQSRAFRSKFEKEWFGKEGWIDQITDKKTQESMYKMMRDIRGVARTNDAFVREARRSYDDIVRRFGFNSEMEKVARVDYGRKMSKVLMGYEDLIHMDMPEYVSRFEPLHFFQYAVRNPETQAYHWLPDDSIDIYQVMHKFARDGDWAGMSAFETTGRNLNLYKVSPTSPQWGEVSMPDIERHFSHYADWSVAIDSGEALPIKDWSVPKLRYTLTGTKPGHGAEMAKAMELTPEEFAKRLTHGRLQLMTAEYPVKNSERLVDTMVHRGFMGRRFTSILDMAVQRQNQLFKDYFSLKGGLKWSAYTNAYWFAKRGGGQDWASGYMLPDVWREVKWYTGEHELYNDAFIDFFANEGSDQGDLFNKMLQYLPWEFLARNVFANFKPLNDMYESFKSEEVRDRVENLAFYSNSEPDCEECGINLSAENILAFMPNFYAMRGTTSYVLEDTVSEKAKKKGSTIITFSRHMNLSGTEEGSSEEGKIDLVQEMRAGNSCRQKVQDILPGKIMNAACNLFGRECNPSSVGGWMAFGESLSYMIFGWSAVFATAFQQLYYAPQIQDCVDVDEGYYVHIFAPAEEEKQGSEAPAQLSTEKVAEMTQQGFDTLMGLFRSDENTYTSQAAEKLDETVKNFIEGSESDDLVQARIDTEQFSSGILESERLYSFWFKGETNPSAFKSSGKKVVGDPDSNRFLEINFGEGKVYYVVDENGVRKKTTLIDNNIVTALESTNLSIPAEEFPKRLTVLGLPAKKELIFKMGTDSELIATSREVLDCIRQGILDQTGLEFTSYGKESGNLTSAFGKVVNIVTTTHPTIKAWEEKQRIVAEGAPRLMVEGATARVEIYSDRNTLLSNNSTKEAGLLQSIIFENGLILYKPYTNELIIWLKRNAQAAISQEDVSGMKTHLAETVNPETECPEPAVEIEAIAVPGSDLKEEKVEQFNQSLTEMGPFQIFETPTRRFIIYSKLVGDECIDFIKIINKETGEVYEAPIESIQQTADGIHIEDAEGNDHDLKFSAENGIPTITYNTYPPETLTMAQGRNGAFWYDPETGMWYSENGQLIPLIEAFRRGSLTQVGKDGEVVSKPGDNILNVQTGPQQPGLWNLPSLPENALELLFFLSLLIGAVLLVRRRILIVRKKN